MVGYLYTNKILYKDQYGFRSGHSTTHPLLRFLDKIYNAFNNKTPNFCLGIFCDLKKAFDTVNFSILLSKLEHYGFSGTPLKWFQSYLRGRSQFVNIRGENSSIRTLFTGVLQGSILGPLLFLIYINDLPNSVDLFSLLFADDTTFQITGQNLKNVFEKANLELSKASEWFASNKLTLNVSKTKFILFHKKGTPVDLSGLSLNIGNEKLEQIGNNLSTKSFKFVGIHLDEHLDWSHHIKFLHNKLLSANYVTSTSKNILPRHLRILLYNSLFKSQLEYGILSWGGVKSSQFKGIINLLKKCIRNVANKDYQSHTDPLFKQLNLLKLEDIFKYNCKVFMYKYAHGLQPSSFNDMFIPLRSHNRNGKYHIHERYSKSIDKFPSIFLPKTWNENSMEFKQEYNLNKFKAYIMQSFLSDYEDTIRCKNKYCPDCH